MAQWGGFEMTNLVRVHDRFKKALNDGEVDAFVRKTLRNLANRVLRKVIFRTPVRQGGGGGTLRRSWKLGAITETTDGYMIEVFNNLEYASFVENGFRAHWVPGHWEGNIFVYEPGAKTGMQVGPRNGWVEGKFMLKISMNEMEAKLQGYLERKQREFLEQLMKDLR